MSLQVGDSVGENQVRLGSADPDDTWDCLYIYIFVNYFKTVNKFKGE